MASLVSPGVSVTIVDNSFFVPASAPTVPLIFIATADEKKQPNGIDAAAGTFESNVIRTVTSLLQSTQLYGIPRFLVDSSGNPQHGDSRNEYGVFALNQYLGIGNLAYVLRANVNLDDSLVNIRTMWDSTLQEVSFVLENMIVSFLNQFNQSNGFLPTDTNYKTTINQTQLLSLTNTATQEVWAKFSFSRTQTDFINDHTSAPFLVFPNGYNQPAVGTGFLGFTGMALAWVTASSGTVVGTEWTSTEAGNMLLNASDLYKFTLQFMNNTSLGANDAARRVAITTALAATINSNTDIRSETYEYNLILCPGFPEMATQMVSLCTDIQEEAMVIADTPFDSTPESVVTWSATVARQSSSDIAYYYPHGTSSNLDGHTVFVAASGIALRTIAFSDVNAELWFAPAGTRRGVVTGVTDVGYVSGTLGTATTFVPTALNQGQRDNLYKYFTNINPIVFFPTRGIIVWGQKTSAPTASALDRINVKRLTAYIKRSLRKNTMSFVFEPNDQLTRDSLKALVDAFLGDLIIKRGLFDFVTLCDGSNNTAQRIDANELWIDIAIKPTKAAEFIMIPIRILANGAPLVAG